jgi:hypothetical protein
MNPSELEALLRLDASVTHKLARPPEGIVNDQRSRAAAQTLQCLANESDAESSEPIAAIGYYRGMRWALDIGDLRWLGLSAPTPSTKQLRREYAEQYCRYRELFELEVAIARRQKAAGMALAQNWTGLRSSLREDAATWRLRLMLRAAGLMFRFGVPGALDLCDSAVFGMFRLLYLRPAA